MARKKRVEIEGGLYHVITRGNDRQDIFHSKEDHTKFLSLIAQQKARSPFFLYAYCLMTNHLHLLIERQEDTVGRIMQRVLTGYSQYYNRKYGRIGHVFQGRYKAILCDSDSYLAALVRYIHLNPVRKRIEKRCFDGGCFDFRDESGAEISIDINQDAGRPTQWKKQEDPNYKESFVTIQGQDAWIWSEGLQGPLPEVTSILIKRPGEPNYGIGIYYYYGGKESSRAIVCKIFSTLRFAPVK